MKFVDAAYMRARFAGKLGEQVSGGAIVSPGIYQGGGDCAGTSVATERLDMAICEAEAWFVRQIPVFKQAGADLLPLDLKAAIADIAFDAMFEAQGKDVKSDTGRAAAARSLILSVAPAYDGATLDAETHEIALDMDACVLNIEQGWDE